MAETFGPMSVNMLTTHEKSSEGRGILTGILTEDVKIIVRSNGIQFNGDFVKGDPKALEHKWILIVVFPGHRSPPESPKGVYSHLTTAIGKAEIWGCVTNGPFITKAILTLDKLTLSKTKDTELCLLSTVDHENDYNFVSLKVSQEGTITAKIVSFDHNSDLARLLNCQGLVMYPSGYVETFKLKIEFRSGRPYIQSNGKDVNWVPSSEDSMDFIPRILDPFNRVVLIQPVFIDKNWKLLTQLGKYSGMFFFSQYNNPGQLTLDVFGKRFISEDIWNTFIYKVPIFQECH